jgi:hypothetical protein
MKNQTFPAIVIFILGLLTPCAANDPTDATVSKSRILNLFHRIQGAKTQTEVERILPKSQFSPLIQNDGVFQCWYVDEPERSMRNHESPWGLAGIVVDYEKGGKVVSSRFNFQWVDERLIQEYRRKFGAEQPGTGQPATRPVVEPEGSDKPQPEAEGRSR